MPRPSSLVVLACVATACLIGCADLSHYTKESSEILTSASPQVDALIASAQSLKERANRLPSSTPGVEEAKAKASTQLQDAQKLKGDLQGFPGRVNEAAKAHDESAAGQLLTEEKVSASSSVENQSKELQTLKDEVAKLEAVPPPEPVKESATPPPFEKTLPSGYALKASPNGLEAQLVTFVEDPSKTPDKALWFELDHLAFKPDSNEVDPEKSHDQLLNIVEILKAYPKTKLKVGAYTDTLGKPATMKKLTAQRAQAVCKALVEMGVPKNRLVPEGHGAENPVCAANDTDECRAQNRRVAVNVATK